MLGAGIPPVQSPTGPPSEVGLVLFAVIVGFFVIMGVVIIAGLVRRSRKARSQALGHGVERAYDRTA